MQDTDILTEAERILDEDLDLAEDADLDLDAGYIDELKAGEYLTVYEQWKGYDDKILMAKLNHRDDERKTLIGEELACKAVLSRIRRDYPSAFKIAREVSKLRANQFAESREAVRKGQQ